MATTSTVKCNSCNLVIDELLSYVQNKISIIDEESLVKICLSTFTSAQIERSKSLLFESLPTGQHRPTRKGQGKENRVLNDIISVFKVTDPDVMPVFVARDLEKLPPITFDHLDVSKLLKDILLVQADIKDIKASYATIQNLEDLKEEVKEIVNAQMRLSQNQDSVILKQCDDPVLSKLSSSNEKNRIATKDKNIISTEGRSNHFVADNKLPLPSSPLPYVHQLTCVGAVSNTSSQPTAIISTSSDQLCVSARMSSKQSFADVTKLVSNVDNSKMISENDGWNLVQGRKPKLKERFMGKMGKNVVDTNEKFRAAERKLPIFISNVSRHTSEKDITDYILRKTSVSVLLERINMKKKSDYNV